jgi:hypothetical protein
MDRGRTHAVGQAVSLRLIDDRAFPWSRTQTNIHHHSWLALSHRWTSGPSTEVRTPGPRQTYNTVQNEIPNTMHTVDLRRNSGLRIMRYSPSLQQPSFINRRTRYQSRSRETIAQRYFAILEGVEHKLDHPALPGGIGRASRATATPRAGPTNEPRGGRVGETADHRAEEDALP